MKKAIILLTLALSLNSLSFVKGVEEKLNIDTTRSSVEWKAGKVTGEHHGIVKLSSGYLLIKQSTLSGGLFEADMASITVLDLKGKSKENLLNHLKSSTFFAVADHPTSTFQIIKVTPAGEDRVNITGDLTIKGITNPVSFPASVKREKEAIIAVAKGVKINRTKYDIKYRSKSFFGDVGDLAINDEFEISVNLVAKK